MGDIDPTIEEAEYRHLCEEVRISCTYGMLLGIPRPQRAAYLLADVIGLTEVEGAEVLDCSREAFRNPCRCGRQIGATKAAGILRGDDLPLAGHIREKVRVWIDPVAKQLDDVVAIGDLYRFDRFAAPAALWDDLEQRFPALLAAG